MKSLLRRLRNAARVSSKPAPPVEVLLPSLGEHWTVKYLQTDSKRVQTRCNGDGVVVVSGRIGNRREVFRGLRRWLVRRARDSFLPWLDELSHSAGFSYENVAIRGQRTRWGSCSSRGTISLNFRLLFLDPDAVRYVLHHELCHTVHLNHSREFWALLATLEPDYRQLNGQAKKGMERVPEWAKE